MPPALAADELQVPEKTLTPWREAELPAPVKKAGESVQNLLLDNTHCSGQNLSANSSVLLTNLHCIQPEFKMEIRDVTGGPSNLRADLAEKTGIRFSGQSIVNPDALPVALKAKNVLDRYYRASGINETKPTLLAAGKGYLIAPPQIRDASEFRTTREHHEDWKAFQEDFALVSMPSTQTAGAGCVRWANEDVKDGEEIWLVGFPEGIFGDDKREKMVSHGPAYTSLASFKEHVLPGSNGVLPEEAWVSEDRYLHANVQVVSGMSGGAAFNRRGEMVGMVLGRPRKNQALLLRSSYLKKMLLQRLGAEKYQALIACPQNSPNSANPPTASHAAGKIPSLRAPAENEEASGGLSAR